MLFHFLNSILGSFLLFMIIYSYIQWDFERDMKEFRKDLFYIDFKKQLSKQLMDKTIDGLRRCAELKLQ